MNAQELTAALAGRWHGGYGTACCPAHEDRNPSLQISDGEAAILLKCHAGCETRDVINALKVRGAWPDHDPSRPPYKRPDKPLQRRSDDGAIKRSEAARRLWNSAVAPQKTPVELYRDSRGLSVELPYTIRYLASAKHADTGLYLPCMLAAVQRWPGQEVVAVHRTFLKTDGSGKAPVSSPKKALGPISGAAVRLAAATDTLGIAEGIETALSAMQLYDDPVWAACGSNLAGVVVPDTVKRVVIYGDNGEAGERAADKAAATFYGQGHKVTIVFPAGNHGDFNDLLQAQQRAAA